MSLADLPPDAPGPGPDSVPALPAAADRGATVIPTKVIARIAARAAREATRPDQATLASPDATARVHEQTARISLTLDLPYPIDLTAATCQVRDYVTARVGQLTGMTITEVTVTVRHLVLTTPAHRRVS
ncbi:Asp23/Gls24 family envelope stress response protein [Streptomyces sp. NPDC059753]|uniref:Asp23/Gls24 family envelope stress response protein n=1 Tax=Streptomyces sp. NPDC059753 TaxID=3346933 RepID=UPI00365B8DDD